MIEITALGQSHQGRVRNSNEDSLLACDLTTGELYPGSFRCRCVLGPRGVLLLVADGMGGEACGELASQMCVDEVPRQLRENLDRTEDLSEALFARSLRRAIGGANEVIFKKSRSHPAYRGMGTTATAAALVGPFLFVAQVGDSRAYLVRGQQLVPLTRDQTFLNYLAELGIATPEDTANDPRKSLLVQAVGSAEALDVKLTGVPLCHGDGVLLCSDGLYNEVKSADLLEVVTSGESLAAKCQSLIDIANANGGADNVTVILAEFTGSGLAKADPASAVKVREFEIGDL